MPGAHKIGAAISGPRIAGGSFMDITLLNSQQNGKMTDVSVKPLGSLHVSLVVRMVEVEPEAV